MSTNWLGPLNDPNTPTWDMLADGGIDLDLVDASPDGTWNLTKGDVRVAFGEAETETGDAAEGWNWTRYSSDGDIEGQDWAETDEALLNVLRSAIA